MVPFLQCHTIREHDLHEVTDEQPTNCETMSFNNQNRITSRTYALTRLFGPCRYRILQWQAAGHDVTVLDLVRTTPIADFGRLGVEWVVRSGERSFPWESIISEGPEVDLNGWSAAGLGAERLARLRRFVVEARQGVPVEAVRVSGVSLQVGCDVLAAEFVGMGFCRALREGPASLAAGLAFIASCSQSLQNLDLR